MKAIAFIFCLFASINVFALATDTIKKHLPLIQGSIAISSQHKPNKALIILDGKVFKGDLSKIDPHSIMTVDVLKGNNAVPIYGPRAALGVILIKTKRYVQQQSAILGQRSANIHKDTLTNKPLVIVNDTIFKGNLNSINPKNIGSINVHKDTAITNYYGPQAVNGVIIIKTKNYQEPNRSSSIDSLVNKDALYVIDGQPSKNKLNDLNPNDILSVDILKKGKGTLEPINDIIVVVTKANAIRSYQKKFSAFSNKYKEYLERHNGKDEDFLYIIDGVQVQGQRSDIITILYKVPFEKIKVVGFNEKRATDGDGNIVIINTKQ